MSYTANDVMTRVLQNIGVLATGESATAEDDALVTPIITNKYAELQRLGVAPFALSAVPEWAFEGVVLFVAAAAAPAFGRPLDASMAEYGLGLLREQMVESNGSGLPIMADYF